MAMSNSEREIVWEMLWETLDGGNYDLDSLKENMRDDSHFTKEIGIDSLDLTEFFLRLEDRFKILLYDEDYESLTSVQAVAEFLKSKNVVLDS